MPRTLRLTLHRWKVCKRDRVSKDDEPKDERNPARLPQAQGPEQRERLVQVLPVEKEEIEEEGLETKARQDCKQQGVPLLAARPSLFDEALLVAGIG